MAADNMILGENARYSMDSRETGLNNNVIVCGSSGCGKTMSVSEPKLLTTCHNSLIVSVTKRRIADKYAPIFEKRGYDVGMLDFVHPNKSTMAYDPLAYVAGYADIPFLAESVVKANPKKERANTDPFWDDGGISLLSAEIAYVLMTQDHPTFADVLNLHHELEFREKDGQYTTALDKPFEYLEKKDPHCFAVSCWKTFRSLPVKTAGCVYGTLNTTIDTIFTPELRKMIAMQRGVDFEKMAQKKTILFVVTSPVNPALHCFANMFYAQAFKSLFEYAESLPDGRLPIPVDILCDDFATGSRILNFPEYISIMREKQISVTLLVQSESQLERMYGSEDAVTIINNCDTYLYMGGMDLKTGRSISERLNKPLEDVLYMPIGQVCIFRRGQKPIVTKRYDIIKDKQYQQIMQAYETHNRGQER